MVKFHIPGMVAVADDQLSRLAGFAPFGALGLLVRRKRVFAVIPFVFDIEFVRASTDDFSGKRVMDELFAHDGDMIYAWFGGFLQSAGNTVDSIADSTMCHICWLWEES